ncbi:MULTISPECIES: hypothetical protein [Methylorubrum]|nr:MULTISPECIES: hypothetical protein [Methylorubrum]MCP1550672.1 hypothetical protein [Methylorubrum zatmanii]MCP1552715.1 hypothetical protein [Methylorubrum extorquens]MCP1580975.1 hypothetical protein [Methylorubrum extorquens]
MTRPRSPLFDLPVILLILPPVLCALGWLALGMVDLPPMPWSFR